MTENKNTPPVNSSPNPEKPATPPPKPEVAAAPPANTSEVKPATPKPASAAAAVKTPTNVETKSALATAAAPAGGIPAEPITRRSFIKILTLGWIAFAAVVGGAGTMVLRFMFPNVLFEPKQTFKAGFPNDYIIGEVSTRWTTQHAVWIVRDNLKMYALSTVCTHLGCTPNWLANEAKFKCPCHGSGFYITGVNFEGPAPRPLERFKITLADDGQILVDKTKKFQQEKGEWADPESYLLV